MITGATSVSKTITGASTETPIKITATSHGFDTGQSVKITGVTGNLRANGSWTIIKKDEDEFWLNDSVGEDAYVSGGTANIVELTTSAPHNLVSGQQVIVAKVEGINGVNGTWSNGFSYVLHDPPDPNKISVPSDATGVWTDPSGFIGDAFVAVPSTAVSGRWRRRPIREFKPEFFGAIANDQTKCVENLVAFNQMIAALGPTGAHIHGDTVLISNKFHVSDTVHITRPVRWTMQGVGSISGTEQFGPGQITFPPGVTGLTLHTTFTSGEGGEAENSTLDGVFVSVEPPVIVSPRTDKTPYLKGDFVSLPAPKRENATPYAVGDLTSLSSEVRYQLLCIASTGSTDDPQPESLSTLIPGTKYTDGDITWVAVVADRYYFLCTVGGVSASVQPLALTSAMNGGLYADDEVTWQAVLADRDRIRVWHPSTTYATGDLVRLPYDPRYVFVCTTSGESDTTVPADFTGPQLHQQNIVDALVRWRCDVYAGILVIAPLVKLVDCTSLGFAGMGQHFQGTSGDIPQTNANNCSTDRGRHIDCGGGVLMRGDNCNGNQITNHDALSLGSNQYGQIGVGYWDRSLAGCLWQSCYTEGGTGAGIIAEAVVLGEWNHCFSENYLPSSYKGTCTVRGGSDDFVADPAVTFDRPTGRTQVRTIDIQGAIGFRTYVDFQNGSSFNGFGSDDERDILYTHVYTGTHYNLAYGNAVQTLSFSGTRSEDGPGHFSIAYGEFVGLGARHYIGYDPTAYALKSIRGGKRIGGDMFVGTTVAPTDGDWLYKTVKSGGYAGVAWGNLLDPVTVDAFVPHRVFADIVIAPNGAFKCTKAGSRGRVEPTWAAAIALSTHGAHVWTAKTEVSDRDVVRATGIGVENGYHLSSSTDDYPVWTADTEFAANVVITPSSPNGHYFVNDILKWTPKRNFLMGMICTPSSSTDPAYGRIYQAVTQVSDKQVPLVGEDKFGASSGTTGATEPTWALNGLFTDDIVAPGSIRWLEIHPKSGASEPQWGKITNVDFANGVLLDGDSLSGQLFWRHVYPTTGTVEPIWRHNSDSFKDNPDAKFVGDPGFGIIWVRNGGEGTEPDNSVIKESNGGTAEWSLIDATPITGVALMWENPNTALEQRAEIVWGEGGAQPSVPTCVQRQQRDAIETTDEAANVILARYELDGDSMSYVEVTVTAMQHASGGIGAPDGAAFKLAGAWFRDASGSPVQRKAPTVAESNLNTDGSAWSAGLALNGNSVEVQVTGAAGKIISWNCVRQGIEGS